MAASRLHSMLEETGAAGAGHGSPRASRAAWRRSSGPGHLRSRRFLSPSPFGT